MNGLQGWREKVRPKSATREIREGPLNWRQRELDEEEGDDPRVPLSLVTAVGVFHSVFLENFPLLPWFLFFSSLFIFSASCNVTMLL